MKKSISWLCLLLLLFSASTSLAEEIVLEEFEFLDKIPQNNLYTALQIEGIDYPVFAYEHVDGITAFRVYGKRGRRTGYFVADLLYEDGEFSLEVTGDAPRKDSGNSSAVASPTTREFLKVPENWFFDYEGNYIYFVDIFGEQNNYALGYYREGEIGIIPVAKNKRMIKGQLALDPESVAHAIKEKPYDFKKPRELNKGYQTKVFIYTTNRERVSVPTTLPVLIPEEMEISMKIRTYARARVGQTNADFVAIQKMLFELGYYAGDFDGVYGEGMDAGLRIFQRQHGLKETGKPDDNTLKTLYFGMPKKNPDPVKAEDFAGNGLGGDKWTTNWLDKVGK